MKVRASAIQASRWCHDYHTLETMDTASTESGTSDHDLVADLLTGMTVLQPDDDPAFVKFWKWWNDLGFWDPVLVEPEWSVKIGDHIVTGHPDAVFEDDDTIYIPDWKFGHQFAVPATADSAQLIAYGVMAGEKCGWLKKIIVDTVKCNHQERDTVEITPDHRDYLIGILDDIATGGFSPGPQCSRCLARQNCDTYLDGGHELVPVKAVHGEITEANAAKAAQSLKAAEELCKIVKKNLIAYVAENGPIRVDDEHVWCGKSHDREVVADHVKCAKAIRDTMADDDGDISDIVWHVSVSKGAVLAAATDDRIEALRESGALKTTTVMKYGIRKGQGDE